MPRRYLYPSATYFSHHRCEQLIVNVSIAYVLADRPTVWADGPMGLCVFLGLVLEFLEIHLRACLRAKNES
jgi:hypothetical protein